MTCHAVCISRALGAGGTEVGQRAADRLGFLYLDEEIIARAAAKGGITPGEVADEERRKSALSRLLREIGRGAAAESYGLAGASGLAVEEASPDLIRGLISEAIEETAGRGDVVIVAHAASFALSGRPGVLRVLVTASPKTRAQRLAELNGIEPKAAAKSIKESDAARADYLRRFYNVSAELPTHYDLVINTDVLGIEQAAELIAHAAG